MNWGWDLKDYIRHLLNLGKGPSSEEFQKLLLFYDRQKLNALIQEIKQEDKKNE